MATIPSVCQRACDRGHSLVITLGGTKIRYINVVDLPLRRVRGITAKMSADGDGDCFSADNHVSATYSSSPACEWTVTLNR